MPLASKPPSSGTVLSRICQAGSSPLFLPALTGNAGTFGSPESLAMRKSPPRHWFERCILPFSSKFEVEMVLALPFSSPLHLHSSTGVTQRMGDKT